MPTYGRDFYEKHATGMANSATVILGLIYKHYRPESVIDVGCGRGVWLRAAESFGAKILKGIDGDWVNREDLLSANIDFAAVDLDGPLPKLNEKYDLCISLEVAEHLPEKNAESFVDFLCKASDTILFGGAVKYQGGRHHVNEQWQSYWIELFRSRGYECIDCIRGSIWNNASVEWWYKQNTFVFVGPSNTNAKVAELKALEKPIFDVVHPLNYERKILSYRDRTDHPTFRFCAGCIKRWLIGKLNRTKA